MRRVAAVLLALAAVFAVCIPGAAAEPAEAPAAQPAAADLARPADIDWGSCASALVPGLGGGLDCAASILGTGADLATDVAADVFAEFLEPFVNELREFVGDMVYTGFTWWLMAPSPRIADIGGLLDGDAEDQDQMNLAALCLGIGVCIATLLTIVQGMRAIIRRKPAPLIQAVKGLMLHVIAVGVGVAVIDGLLAASDEMTGAILDAGFAAGGDPPQQMRAMLLPEVGNMVAMLFMAVFVLFIGFVQLFMLFLRQASLPVLALLLPVASSGQVGEGATQQWLPRIVTMIMTVICYKPMAALIITIGFVQMEEAVELLDWLRGLITLLLSAIALGAMLKLFAPFGANVGNAVAAGGGLAGAMTSLASFAALRGGGETAAGAAAAPTTAVQHSQTMEGLRERGGSASAGGPGGDGKDAREGDRAIQHQSSSAPVPEQRAEGAGGKAEQSGQQPGTETAGQPGTSTGTGSAPAPGAAASTSGQVRVAVVAAEAARNAANSAGNKVSGEGGGQ